jgi:hypothetical protein
MSSRSALLLLSSIFSVAACSSEPAASNGVKDTGTVVTDGGTDSGGEDDGPAKEPCSEPGPPGSQCVKTITGKVVDESGAPLGEKLVSVCGQVCFFGQTTADGSFVTKVNQNIKIANFAAAVHGRPDHASLYEKIPVSTSETIALPKTLVLPKLNATGMKIPITVSGAKRVVTSAVNITDGDITLGFAADTEVDLDIEDIALVAEGKPGDHLRVVKVPEANYPSFVSGANVKLLYAASPFDLKFLNKKVSLTINATGGLAEGSVVEIISLGNEFLVEPFSAGKLEVVATGKVTGGKIVTDAGEGLKTLTWFGVRAK